MADQELAAPLLKTVWRDVRNTAETMYLGIQDGAGQVMRDKEGNPLLNPFNKQPVERSVTPEAARLHSRLMAAGLARDWSFMRDLRAVLRDCALEPVLGLLTAFDGEAAFEENARFEVRVVDGPRLPTYLHEIFYEFEPDTSNG